MPEHATLPHFPKIADNLGRDLVDYCRNDAKIVLAVSRTAGEWWKGDVFVPKTAKARVSCHALTRRFLFEQQPKYLGISKEPGNNQNLHLVSR